MDQFTQMRNMLLLFLGQKQETSYTAFCNNLALEVEGLDEKDFQTFKNEAVSFLAAFKAEQKNMVISPTATDSFTKLKCNFNICASDISLATAASSSCKGLHLNHPRDSEACKSDHATHSAEPSGNQSTAATIQRAANFFPSH